jgi:PIN domain nuclease of toxin-antitoxin system
MARRPPPRRSIKRAGSYGPISLAISSHGLLCGGRYSRRALVPFSDSRLSSAAKSFIDRAAENGTRVALSSIPLVETLYLVEKRRLRAEAYDSLRTMLSGPDHVFKEEPLGAAVVEAMRQIPRDAVPDLPDRIVTATALHLAVSVLSRDGRIRASTVTTFW